MPIETQLNQQKDSQHPPKTASTQFKVQKEVHYCCQCNSFLYVTSTILSISQVTSVTDVKLQKLKEILVRLQWKLVFKVVLIYYSPSWAEDKSS